MCRMCEGFSLEDTLALDAAAISEYGYIVIGVGAAPNGAPGAAPTCQPWAYTVGLLDRTAHPELIVAGPDFEPEGSGALLNELGRAVLGGARFAAGDPVRVRSGVARIGAMHPIQYELDTFNVWHNLKSIGVLQASELEALQVFVPPEWFRECHRDAEPVLADPTSRVGAPLPCPNRAARRDRRR